MTALRTGNFEHEVRDVQAEKNLLAIGDVTPEVVLQLIQQTTGREHSTCPHHWDRSITVHLMKPATSTGRWYIKAYFIEGEETAVFISVHK